MVIVVLLDELPSHSGCRIWLPMELEYLSLRLASLAGVMVSTSPVEEEGSKIPFPFPIIPVKAGIYALLLPASRYSVNSLNPHS